MIQPSAERRLMPQEPVHRFLKPLQQFLHVEAASGVVLLVCAVSALVLANSPWAEGFLGFWKTTFGLTIGDFQLENSLKHWINDGLMAIFFFVIGLEVKRELVLGELRDFRRASLPVAAAIGGMVVPAGIYFALQFGEPGQRGWGIPMATDIAFVVGCMAILGRRIPAALRVILLSIAIVDDIGAILVIAFGYTESLSLAWLTVGIIGIGVVVLLQRLGVRSMGVYTLVGITVWLGFHESGIHATIAGVVIGLLTPARAYLAGSVGGELLHQAGELLQGKTARNEKIQSDTQPTSPQPQDPHSALRVGKYRRVAKEMISPLEYLIHLLHPWVAFVIMPLFALANAGVQFQAADMVSPAAIAVIVGLAIGKPLGIVLASWFMLTLRLANFPTGVRWPHLIGGGFLAGIGFTMALFIAGLAFTDETLLRSAKVGVLAGSLLAAIIGMTVLALNKPSKL